MLPQEDRALVVEIGDGVGGWRAEVDSVLNDVAITRQLLERGALD